MIGASVVHELYHFSLRHPLRNLLTEFYSLIRQCLWLLHPNVRLENSIYELAQRNRRDCRYYKLVRISYVIYIMERGLIDGFINSKISRYKELITYNV